jgi:hypothetical protein
MSSWVANFIDGCKTLQKGVLLEFPEQKRREAHGRAAKLIIDGPQGGVWELWFTNDAGIADKPADVPIKNTIYMREDTLLDLITPDVDIETLVQIIEQEGLATAIYRLRPRLNFRTALANRLVTVDGEKPDVDSEEWAQIIEKFLTKIAFPMVIEAMLKKWRENAKRTK